MALSSGEAELYASVARLSRFLGLIHLVRELRGEAWGHLRHEVDAVACKGMLMRKGAGGVKHTAAKHLWVQEAIENYRVAIQKIPRELNLADALASCSSGPTLASQLEAMNCMRQSG